ncbi:hypothetical protein TU86_14010 [Pseudomonas weihenstephanensis]|uniref:Uncharacterized protein n=1 Tax=Pseudomonas weihenstephanensis TaxID=1608994 RepID=A0A0J6ILK3_9PSED|nr:hypothetical protein [Pseudomonas weihenstephanensis]KMN13183.1 hypothetical protein TU86_14010 [Pseudomonas weihenstephanensis]
MSKTPDDKVTEPAAPVLQKTAPARTFRDKVYTSRTLILPGGASLPVAKGRATAVDDQQFQYLNSHPDFERLTE